MSSVRRQASLGTEFTRIYGEDAQQLKVVLAHVTRVNFRYNTVDLVSVSGKMRSDKSGDGQGRFSAKLPVQFGGRTTEGKPYGQTIPVSVGSLVLVGFVDGQKGQPVVVSVYNSSDESRDLSRSPVAGEGSPSTNLEKDTQHMFTVFPSLTYEDIDGLGNRKVSFTGKTFLSMDSDVDPEIGDITDDGNGTTYEELDSSYYYTGELIQPKDKKAPNILFRHVGNRVDSSGQEIEDGHVTMMTLAQDGTYRMSVLREEEDWRSMFEMAPDGTMKLRTQTDTKAIGQGNDVHEISVGRTGIMLRSHDKYLILNEDGLSSNVGIGGGGNYDAAIEDLREGILKQNTKIDQTSEYVRITATQIEKDVEGKITDFEASFEVTAKQIELRVTERVSEAVSEQLGDISEDIDALNKEAQEALATLGSLIDDGVLNPIEKKTIRLEWDIIKAEYSGYLAQAEAVGVSTTDYKTRYDALAKYIAPILEDMETSTNVDRTIFLMNFQGYFNARSNLLYTIFEFMKKSIDDLEERVVQAGKDILDASQDAMDAFRDAQKANDLLTAMASDNKLTPQEKSALRREYTEILSEWGNIVAQASAYEVPSMNFIDAKDAVIDFVETSGIFNNMQETSDINGALFLDTFLTYYEEKGIIVRNVITETRKILLSFQGDLEHFETSITTTSKEISLVAQSVSLLGKDVRLNKAEISVQANRISQRVTRVEMHREVNTTVNKLNNVGRNLFIKGRTSVGELNPDTGAVVTGANNPQVSPYIEVESLASYVISVFGSLELNRVIVTWYDLNKVLIGTDSISDSKDPLVLITDSPIGTKFARVSTQRRNNVRVQFEKGVVSTNFKASPEDMVADLEVARTERESRKEVFDSTLAQADDLKAKGIQDLSVIETILADFILTPAEKIIAKEMIDRLEREDEQVKALGLVYNVDTNALLGSFTSLMDYVRPFFVDMSHQHSVIKNVVVRLYDNYLSDRDKVMDNIVKRTRDSFEASDAILDEVSASSLEAQKLAERLAEEAEQLAREASRVREYMIVSDQLESGAMAQVRTIANTSILKSEDKPLAEGLMVTISEEIQELLALSSVYSLSTDDVNGAYNRLSAYLSPMLTAENRILDTSINTQTFINHFQSYYTAKGVLLQGVLDGANGKFEEADKQSMIANEEYRRRQEQMNTYQNAIKDSQTQIDRINDTIDELNNTIPYYLELTSTNGYIFRDNNINTKIVARYFKGSEEITEQVPIENFVWRKLDQDGNEDTTWGAANTGVGREILVTHEDVQGKATFELEIDMEGVE